MLTCRPACTWNGGSPRAGDGRDGMFLRVAAGLLHHHGTEVAAIFFASLWKLPCFLEMMMFKDGSSAKTRATLGKKWYIFLILQPLRFLRLTRPCFSPFWWMEFIFGESHVGRRKSNKQRSLRPTGSVGVKGFFKLSHKKDTNVDELWVIWNYTTWVLGFFFELTQI